MGRKSTHNLLPGIHLDQQGSYWATLEGENAKHWRERYPGRTLPRRKAGTEKEARTLQRQLVRDLESGRDPNAKNPKVADWVRTVIDGKQKIATSTKNRYESSLKYQIEPHRIGRMRLTQLTHELIEAWVRDLKVQPHQRNPDRMLDPYTIRNAFAVLRLALNVAVDRDLLAKNPCRGVELPRPDDDEIQPLTPPQVEVLLRLLDTYVPDNASGQRSPHRNAALYHVALRCGLRQGELLGLRWIDINLERRTLTVAGQLKDGERTRTKTKRSTRTIPISADTVAALRWHKTNQTEERAIAQKGWNAADLVFCSDTGAPLDKSNANQQLTRFLKLAELPRIRFHDMRHTYAALSIAAGTDIYTLSRRMGHSSISVTADRYGHLYEGDSHDVDSVDRLIKKGA